MHKFPSQELFYMASRHAAVQQNQAYKLALIRVKTHIREHPVSDTRVTEGAIDAFRFSEVMAVVFDTTMELIAVDIASDTVVKI